jgi:uncharacterized protein (TIGR03000 family)
MYSVVLMAALTTGGNTPDCGLLRSWCHRSCYSCAGCAGCWGCSGCYGCAGGCWGSCYGGYYSSCYGGCYGGCWGATYISSCYGCQGCYGCAGAIYVPVAPAPVMPPVPGTEGKKDKESVLPTKAKLLVEVPTDAKLYIDDRLMKTSAPVRSFSTPTLDDGQAYYYILRAEVVREGKTYQETKRVIVRAGEQVRATFPDLEAATAVAVKQESSR